MRSLGPSSGGGRPFAPSAARLPAPGYSGPPAVTPPPPPWIYCMLRISIKPQNKAETETSHMIQRVRPLTALTTPAAWPSGSSELREDDDGLRTGRRPTSRGHGCGLARCSGEYCGPRWAQQCFAANLLKFFTVTLLTLQRIFKAI